MLPSRKLAASIIDVFEELLNVNNIMIPDEFREGNENEAMIFGKTYYNLEDHITRMIELYLK